MNIALTGGGTAGHIVPNLALSDALKNKFNNIYYYGNSKGMEKSLTKGYGLRFVHTPSIKFSRDKLLSNIRIFYYLPKYIIECKKLLIKNNINIVFSKGGYVALPICLAAYLLKIPVICHESDYSLGITNKITSKFAKYTLTSFEETPLKKGFKYIGMPIRESMFFGDASIVQKRHKIPKSMPLILVMGGSLGSLTINKAILSILDKLTIDFFVIHITGQDKNIELKNYVALKFVSDIQNYIKAASLIVCRCGSTTAFEISSLNKKVLYIPLSKKASRGDQIENAKYFQKHNYANVLFEENLNASSLYREIIRTFNMQKALFKYNKNTINKIVSLIYKTAISKS